jgi:hypothetical protein
MRRAVTSRKKLKIRWGTQLAFSHCITGGGPDGPASNTARRFPKTLDSSTRAKEFTMRHFLSNLVRNFQTAKAARPARRVPHRAMLQLERLEDRLVPTTSVSLNGSALTISNVPQNDLIKFQGYGSDGMQVLDNGHSVYTNTNKQSISTVNLQSAEQTVVVDDSNGMPFAYGTTINLSSSVGGNLYLEGSRAVSGNEVYVAGGAPWTFGMIQLDNSTFNLDPSMHTVTDDIQITGTFDVQTSGTAVQLVGGYLGAPVSAGFSGLGSGGGSNYLAYAFKPHVVLEDYSAGAQVSGSVYDESLEQSFTVNLHETGDSAIINGTPSNVLTTVNTTVAPVANQAAVYVEGNTGEVVVNGNSSTYVSLGESYTSPYIQGTVVVNGAGTLAILEEGNASTENAVVTPDSISGTGLFGNSSVTVWYSQVGSLDIDTGAAAAVYTIETTSTAPEFFSTITIEDNSTSSFRANVNVDSSSNLNLVLYNNATPLSDAVVAFELQSGEGLFFNGTPSGDGVAKVINANEDVAGTVTYYGFVV